MQAALRSLISKLNSFKSTPDKGLALFCGYGIDPLDGKEKKISVAFEPWAPLNTGMYRCDAKFHTEVLHEQLGDTMTYGFIIVDGDQTTFHKLTGDSKVTIFKLNVNLPKKHDKGGQSKNRFERIRVEKRGWYTSKVAELATNHFIDQSTNQPNVSGIIIGGSASIKDDVHKKMDPRLVKVVLSVVDLQYNGASGLNQAITLCTPLLANVKIVQERDILSKFYDNISRNGKYCIGIEDTLYSLTSGMIETLLLWKQLKSKRVELVSEEAKKVIYLNESESLKNLGEWKVVDIMDTVDWILEHYKEFGAKIQLVSDITELGSQFIKGFGGLGGFLRFDIELPSSGILEESEEDEYTW